ncbi:MAG TPA: restriction endonuclease subunit S [Flavobacteriales bacterium]|nr:restriction endonuclease subunit S [Flavobacteriales bacterium]
MKSGWVEGKLVDFVEEFIVPQRDKPKVFSGTIPWCRIEDIEGVYLSESKSGKTVTEQAVKEMPLRVFPKDTVLVSCSADLGRCAIAAQPLVTNQTFIGLVPKRTITSQYLYYLMTSRAAELNDAATGATIKYLSQDKFKALKVAVPSISEQQRIVTKLDAAFGALREAEGHVERNRANARELFESYLNGVFEGKEGWEETTLGEIGKVCMCKRILKEQTTSTGDIPFYKIGTFGKEPDAYIPKEIYEEFKRKYSFPKMGDVLISASGTIGRGVVYDGEPAYFQDSNIVWIDNNEEQVLNEYLFQFYKVCDWSPTKGATISRLYNDDLRKVRIAFPSLQEQRKLVAQMVELDAQTQALEATYQQKLRELEGLKKGLLGAAFRGEL